MKYCINEDTGLLNTRVATTDFEGNHCNQQKPGSWEYTNKVPEQQRTRVMQTRSQNDWLESFGKDY